MQKQHKLEIASWGAVALSVTIAFAIVFVQWRQQLNTRQAKERLTRQLVREEQAQAEMKSQNRPVLETLTMTQGGREDSAFLGKIQSLMTVSGVKQVQIERVPISQLPVMQGSPGAPTVVQNGEGVPGEPALAHLPLKVTALSTRLTVEGTYAGIYQFLQRLQTLRHHSRAVNTNGINIETLHDGEVRAAITVTRFVRPVLSTGS